MRFLGWLVVAAVTARALVACGGDDEAPPDPGSADAGHGDSAANTPDAKTNPPSDSSVIPDVVADANGPTEDADSGSAELADADAGADADADAGADAGDLPTPQGAHLAVGFGTACAIDGAGVLECWGGGANNVPGLLTPTTIDPGSTWAEISAGRSLCGLHTDGTLWCWNPGATPTQPDTSRFIHVSTGDSHSCAIKPDGSLYCWGSNSDGQLGVGDENSHSGLQKIAGPSDWASVSAGHGHTCAIKTNGALYCWGNNTWGQVWSGKTYNDVTSPTQIVDGTWSEVSAGNDATCARRTDGALFCWGTLGDAQNKPPKQIDTATDWAHTSSHGSHNCTLKTGGALYCFGGNTYGQMGVSGTGSLSSPTLVPSATTWSDVAAGDWTTCARKSDGSVWCWGAGMYGQLGLGAPYGPHLSPTQVTGTWKSVSAGNVTMCGVRGDGTIACWGLVINLLPSSLQFLAQAPVTVDPGTSWDTVQLANDASMCARKTDTSLWCRTNGNAFATTGLAVTSYAHAQGHTCGITPAQALYCWGANDQGQLGLPLDGGTTVASPTQIGSDTWTAVSADYSTTCGVRTDGTTWCWGGGDPTMKQVGSSTTWTNLSVNSGRAGVNGGGVYTWSSAGSPAQVGTATDWVNVTNGIFSYCGAKTDGTLHCWGNNFSGQLGDGTTTSHSLPAPAGSATNWSYATIGNSSACGLRTNGTLYCWGDNTWAMMGDNSAWVSTPTAVLP